MLIGATIMSGSAVNTEILGFLGYDFVWIDTEHAPTSPLGKEMQELIRAAYAADITPLVRVIHNDLSQIRKALDFGAKGIIAPFINTIDDARKLVKSCLYPPEGERGACPAVRATGYGTMNWIQYAKSSNEEIIVSAILEREEAVRNAEEICSVQGINLVWRGFLDLAMDLGIANGGSALSESMELMADPLIEKYTKKIIDVAREHGVYLGDVAFNSDSALELAKKGFQMISFPPDTVVYAGIAKKSLAEARAAIKNIKS